MAKVVTVINCKGGVGKTTVSIEVATSLARFSHQRVLLVDLDPHYLDHIIARSKGGATTVENLQVLCRACNLKKGNR